MATILKRAKHHIIRSFSDLNDFQAGYLIGAEEQKQIDIDKACEWLEEHLNDDFIKRVSIEEFRKTMEEKQHGND